jgi:ankyrin repeat protein
VVLASNAALARTELDAALDKAIRAGNLELVKQLVAKGVDVNESGAGPLYEAVFRDQLEIVKFLVSAGANVNGVMMYGPIATPLRIAARRALYSKNYKMVDYLLSVGADPAAGGVRMHSPLTAAVMTGHLDQVKRIMDRGNADVEYKRRAYTGRGSKGPTALMIAAQRGFAEIVAYLVERGAQLNNSHDCGRTALYHAAKSGAVPVVKYLLHKGAEVNPARQPGCHSHPTPIRHAKGEEVIRLLLDAGAMDNRHIPSPRGPYK